MSADFCRERPNASSTTRMTGGDAIVDALLANGVDTLFGLPGAQMYPLFDALQRRGDRIATIGTRHEQACGYMAFGYARSTGRPGVFSVVPGPGVLNTMAALCTAWGCNAPVLCITGQVPTPFIGRGRGHLHELPDQLGTLRSLAKWAARIEHVADAPAVIAEAFRTMLSGRPGPVVVEMAWDVMARSEMVPPAITAIIPAAPPPSSDEIAAAAALLRGAKRPMIMVGSGAQHASAEILALAETLGAPVAAFRGGRGVVPEDHPLGLSSHAAWRLWPDCDALIGIGTRLEMPYMRWSGMMTLVDAPTAPPHLIRIDIDPVEMRRLRPHAGIVADAAAGADALCLALSGRGASDAGAAIATAKRDAAAAVAEIKPHAGFLAVIRDVLPRDGFLVEELCQTGFTSYFAYPVLAPRTYVSPGFQGTLGCGFMSALGVKVAHPDQPVVSITGDGGFMFGVQEMATAVQYGIGLITVLFNNGAYGNVLRDQQTTFGGRLIGSELRNPDFQALAASFGVSSTRVYDAAGFEAALRAAVAAGGPTLIEVMVDRTREMSPWPLIHPQR